MRAPVSTPAMYAASMSAPLAPRCPASDKHRRQHADRQMNNAGHMRVVVVEPMAQHAVQQRCIALRQTLRHSDHRTLALPFRQRIRRPRISRGEFLLTRCQRAADGVEYQVARSQTHFDRDLVEAHAVGEARQCAGDRVRRCKQVFHYSTFAPESLTALVHFVSSLLTNAPSSSGVICIGSTPCARN